MKLRLLMGLIILTFVSSNACQAEFMLYKDHTNLQAGVEGLGAGLFYSGYGSYRWSSNFVLNVGFGYVKLQSQGPVDVFSVPVSFSLLIGEQLNFMELLAGVNFQLYSRTAFFSNNIQSVLTSQPVLPEVGLGWRYWPKFGGIGLRATAYFLIANQSVYIWPGASVGYTF